MSESGYVMSPKKRWLIFAVVVFASISISVARSKVSGTMVYIREDWGIDVTTGGLLVSLVSMANLIMALPGGALVQKLGSRKVLLFALGLCVVANIVGALAPNFEVLAATRFCEGITVAILFIVPPAIFAQVFPAEERGLPMALWSLWSPVGTLIVLNVCNIVTPQFGWQANWWVVAAIVAVAFVLVFIFLRLPAEGTQVAAKSSNKPKQKAPWSKLLTSVVALCICGVFFAAQFGWQAYLSYFTTYLKDVVGTTAVEANSIVSIPTYVMIAVSLSFGFLLKKIPNKFHPKLLFVAIIILLIGVTTMWNAPIVGLAVAAISIAAVGMQSVGPLVHDLMPDAVPKTMVPMGMAMLSFSSALGGTFGPLACGMVVDSTSNWGLVAIPMGIVAALGIAAAVVVIVKMRKIYSAKEAQA